MRNRARLFWVLTASLFLSGFIYYPTVWAGPHKMVDQVPLNVKQGPLYTRYFQLEQPIKRFSIYKVLCQYPAVKTDVFWSKCYLFSSWIMQITGAALIGYNGYEYVGYRDTNMGQLAAGGGLIAAGVMAWVAADSRLVKAAVNYNRLVKKTGTGPGNHNYDVGISLTGRPATVNLQLQF